MSATQPDAPSAITAADFADASGTAQSASEGTGVAAEQHEAATDQPAASPPDAGIDRSSAISAALGHEAQAAPRVEHCSQVLLLPAAGDGSGMGSGPASAASWPASQAANDVNALSYAGIMGSARQATPGAASDDAGVPQDPDSTPQQDGDAVTTGPDHGRAQAESLSLRIQRLAMQPSDVTAGSSGLLAAAADAAGSGYQPATREQHQAVSEVSAREPDAVQASDAAAAEQRSDAAAEAVSASLPAGHRPALGGDAEDMGSSWESDMHAGAGC